MTFLFLFFGDEMADKIKQRIDELRREILKHNELYYTKGAPSVSDSRYDELMGELKKLEAEHPEYDSPGSPSHTVGAPVPEKFRKVEHTAPMLSLESVTDEEGARHFDDTCARAAGEKTDYTCEPKLDGISIELVYENGMFARGSTRGDGRTGEDVTLNLKTIGTVPQRINSRNAPALLAVRGEVMMHISDFQELNRKQAESGKDVFANPRNVVAGSMRQLDYRITAERKLRVYCYRILEFSGAMPPTQWEALELLKEYGFSVSPNIKRCGDIEEAIRYHHEMEKGRDSLDYEIDGIVIKVNSLKHQAALGTRTNNPKWSVAYKFKPRKEVTRVDNIVVQVGRTGVVTPLALLNPVEVGGVTVSRATLHNMDQVERLGIKIGDYVKVERAGDVIPYVSEVMIGKRTGGEKTFRMPEKCPSCGTKLEKEDVFWRCPAGLACPAQLKETMIHYSSKGAVDIEGFSEKTVNLLYEKGMVKGISDIYRLKKEDLLALEGWKEKKTDNLLKAIEEARKVPLERFLCGLGIRNVGKHLARVLADKYGSLDKVMAATEEDLLRINEIGPEIAASIRHFFSREKNLKEIEKLRENGVVIQDRKSVGGRLSGKKIVFTGSLETMSRSEAQKMVEAEGGEALSSVTSETDLVVAGEKAGSKLKKAREKGVKVIDEKEFRKMMG
ncbi:MAG: NAD-dependent DNA ligase LigA [Candidatus Omnitrophica bacterium]|nr:NAD-dependent DNA ligase LigA [Candidatus Omnitrophota bacterium]